LRSHTGTHDSMRLLESLFNPWLAQLLRQRAVCRAILVAFLVLGFGAWMNWLLWPCLFAEITGLPCPGCGLTRATSSLLHGDWRASWQYHPFAGFFVLVGLLVAAGALMRPLWVEELAVKVERFERRTKLPAIILVGLVCFGLLRMLGYWYQPPVGDFSGRFQRKSEASSPVKVR
jgi:hypothetical protein